MRKNQIGKKAFIELLNRLKSPEHNLMGVPGIMLLSMSLQMLENTGFKDGVPQIGMLAEKVGMHEQLEYILLYCEKNIAEATNIVFSEIRK